MLPLELFTIARKLLQKSISLSRRRFNRLGLAYGVAMALPERRISTPTPIQFLRGVNFTGLTHEAGSQAPAIHAVDYFLVQKRMNVVRLNFTWEFIQPTLNGELDVANVAIIEDQVGRITATGSYTILELHNYGRRSVRGKECIIGESADVTSSHFSDIWRRIATRWGGNPRVIFALMNEPHDQDTKTLVSVSNEAILAIRNANCKNLIMVSGNNWNSLGWFTANNHTLMLNISDPLDHYCFDVHHYFDDWSQGKTPNVRVDPLGSMEEFTKWAKEHRRRAFCGEFGCGINKRGLDACRALLEHIETNRDVFLGWAWLGAGGPWQPDFVFLLDPFASVTSPTNPDPIGSASWRDPVDRPQMKLLQAFLPVGSTPFNGWLIEDQLGSVLEILLRHGDFCPPDRSWFGTNGRAGVPGWHDSGPRRLNAAVSRDLPVSLPDGGVRFAPKGQYVLAQLSSFRRSESIYAMVEVEQATSGMRRSIVGEAGDTHGSGRWVGIMPDNRVSLVRADWSLEPGELPKLMATSRTLVQVAYSSIEGTESRMQAVLGVATQITTIASLSKASSDRGRTVFGAGDAFGKEGLAGTLFDVAVFNTPLSDANNERVQGRLYWDAGLAHVLPDGHRYRRRPPRMAAGNPDASKRTAAG